MNDKTKRVIAREGLIILGIIGIGILIIFLSSIYPPSPVPIKTDIETGRPSTLTPKQFEKAKQEGFVVDKIVSFEQRRLKENCDKARGNLSLIGFLVLVAGYPLYLLIRFIIWATRALKHK